MFGGLSTSRHTLALRPKGANNFPVVAPQHFRLLLVQHIVIKTLCAIKKSFRSSNPLQFGSSVLLLFHNGCLELSCGPSPAPGPRADPRKERAYQLPQLWDERAGDEPQATTLSICLLVRFVFSTAA